MIVLWVSVGGCGPTAQQPTTPPPAEGEAKRCELGDGPPDVLQAESRVIGIGAVKPTLRRSELVTDTARCSFEDCRVVPSLDTPYAAMRPGLLAGTTEIGSRSPHYPRTTLRAFWGETVCEVVDGRVIGVAKEDKEAFDTAWDVFREAVHAASGWPPAPGHPDVCLGCHIRDATLPLVYEATEATQRRFEQARSHGNGMAMRYGWVEVVSGSVPSLNEAIQATPQAFDVLEGSDRGGWPNPGAPDP